MKAKKIKRIKIQKQKKEISQNNTNTKESFNQKKNIFRETRIKKDISINKIAHDTGIDRKIIKNIDNGNFDHIKLIHLIEVSKYLGVNIFQFIRDYYQLDDMEFYSEEIGDLVDRMVWLQMDLIYSELKELAKLTKMRVDDFNVQQILSQRKNLNKLIVLNMRLRKGEITPSEALSHFPILKHGYLRRKNLED